jgi:hypothetical protein
MHHLGAGVGVNANRIHRACIQAPGFGALGTGVGHLASGVLEGKYLDARLGDVEYPVVLEGTRHFALQTAGAFVGVDVQRFLHDAS